MTLEVFFSFGRLSMSGFAGVAGLVGTTLQSWSSPEPGWKTRLLGLFAYSSESSTPGGTPFGQEMLERESPSHHARSAKSFVVSGHREVFPKGQLQDCILRSGLHTS